MYISFLNKAGLRFLGEAGQAGIHEEGRLAGGVGGVSDPLQGEVASTEEDAQRRVNAPRE